MYQPTSAVVSGFALGLLALSGATLQAHDSPAHDSPAHNSPAHRSPALTRVSRNSVVAPPTTPSASTAANARPLAPISGQGKLRFKVFLTSERLPEEARRVLPSAHGGFAVDQRPGRGETYFALRGAGILRISADMRQIQLLPTAPAMKNVNLHDTAIWHGNNGVSYLAFPANDAGLVFTTNLQGRLLHALGSPTVGQDLGFPAVNEYFSRGGKFAPTDVAYLDGQYYITTGYSALDYVLTARITVNPLFTATWNDLSFGGKGNAAGQFGIGHGITVPPGQRRLDVADRPNAKVERFTRYGHYLSTLHLPAGSLTCDINYFGRYAIVPALDGPDKTKGAPIYILQGDQVISTIMPKEELGLANFQHIHGAVMRQFGAKLYIIAQSWNPGDMVILEQVIG